MPFVLIILRIIKIIKKAKFFVYNKKLLFREKEDKGYAKSEKTSRYLIEDYSLLEITYE